MSDNKLDLINSISKKNKIILWVFIWSFLAFAQTVRLYYVYNAEATIISWPKVFIWAFAEFYLWGLIGIFIYRITEKVSFDREQLIPNLGRILFYPPLSAVINLFLFAIVWYYTRNLFTYRLGQSITTFPEAFWSMLSSKFLYSTITGLALFFICVALHYYNRWRAEERRLRQLQLQLSAARLEALKNQLKPHFFFNTLNSIASLVHTDPDKAEETITLLSELLRESFTSDKKQLITLADELELIKTYLAIQKIRFDERLSVNYDISESAKYFPLPKFILQPIVENAIEHGLSHLVEKGEIKISAAVEQQRLTLLIYNNGPASKLSEEEIFQKGVGLSNINERLSHLYQGKHQIEINSSEPTGFEIKLILPRKES